MRSLPSLPQGLLLTTSGSREQKVPSGLKLIDWRRWRWGWWGCGHKEKGKEPTSMWTTSDGREQSAIWAPADRLEVWVEGGWGGWLGVWT